MSEPTATGTSNPEREQRLDEAAAEYMALLAAGTPPNREEWLAGRPDLRLELVEFLDDLDRINSAVGPGRGESSAWRARETKGSIIAKRYILVEKIGEGGMGEVWVARQTEPVRRRVALKLIKTGMDSKAVIARFEAERQALAMMDHPNIAKVLDGGLTEDLRPFFVMELVNGLPLTKFCDEASLSIRERLELLLPICHAVQHAHQKGIVHRDLKPSNILVTQNDGQPIPKVIDFGVAKAILGKLSDDGTLTQFGAVVGTLEYMPPEQAGFQYNDIDTRADIYALGVILYELLTGLRPFDAKRLKQAAFDEMVRMIREDEPSRPSARLSSDDSLPSAAAFRRVEPARLTRMLRGDLDWVVMKCLEKQRDRRYATANGLAHDIQRYLADETIEARPPSRLYRVQKFVRRNRGFVLGASLLTMTIVAGGIATSLALVRARNAERAATQESDRAVAVRDFLTEDLLGQADPENNPRSAGVTVEQLLDRASSRVDQNPALIRHPGAKAEILAVLGETYEGLGNYSKAVEHWRRALELDQQLYADPNEPRTLAAMKGLGQALIGIDEFEEAEDILRRTATRRSQSSGPTHRDTLFANNSLAIALGEQGRFAEAEPLFKSTWQTWSRVYGPNDKDTLQALVNYAAMLTKKGDYASADPLFRSALDGYRAQGLADSPDALNSENAWALNLIHERKLDEAKGLLNETIARKQRVLGPNHALTLGSRSNLGYVLSQLGESAAAVRELTLTYEGLRAEYGPAHRETLAAKNSLVLALRDAKRWDEAKAYARELLDDARRKVGPYENDLVVFTNNLAWIYEGEGDYPEAERLYRESLAIAKEAGHSDDPDSLDSAHNLMRVLFQQQRFDEAVTVGQQTLIARQRVLPPNHPSTMATATDWSSRWSSWNVSMTPNAC